MTQLTDHEKITIVCLHKKGKSIKEISEILNVNRNTISKWISRENLTGYVLRKKGSGRKENINNDGIIKVINIIQNDTYITLDKIYEKLNNINNKVNDQKNEVKLITNARKLSVEN
jgi:transposase